MMIGVGRRDIETTFSGTTLLEGILLAVAALLSLGGLEAGEEVRERRAYAETMFRVWDGGGDGFRFSDPLNWDTDIAPSSVDAAIIPSVYNVVLDQDHTISGDGRIFIEEGATLGVDTGVTLYVGNDFDYVAGIINGGTINNSGAILVINEDTDLGLGTLGIDNLDTGTINNLATIDVLNGGIHSVGIENHGSF